MAQGTTNNVIHPTQPYFRAKAAAKKGMTLYQPTMLSIGDLTEGAIATALADFTRENFPQLDLEEVRALHIRQVDVNLKQQRGGRLGISVQVLAVQRFRDHNHYELHHTIGSGLRWEPCQD